MKKVMQHKIAIVITAIALGSIPISTEALARGGGMASYHASSGVGGGHLSGGIRSYHYGGRWYRKQPTAARQRWNPITESPLSSPTNGASGSPACTAAMC